MGFVSQKYQPDACDCILFKKCQNLREKRVKVNDLNRSKAFRMLGLQESVANSELVTDGFGREWMLEI